MTGLNFTCPGCGKKVRIDIPEVNKLRMEVARLKLIKGDDELNRSIKDGHDLFDTLFPGIGGKHGSDVGQRTEGSCAQSHRGS